MPQADGPAGAERNPGRHQAAGSFFDDKMVVVNASLRGLERGIALPLLLDLARKPVFPPDNSVPDLETLLNPTRGATQPHPFYVSHQQTDAT